MFCKSITTARLMSPGLLLCWGALLGLSASLQGSEPAAQSVRTSDYIVQGSAASTQSFPWMASVFVGSAADPEAGGSCGGALIAPNWVLTAAHCFLNDANTALDLTSDTRTTVTLRSDTLEPLAAGAEVYEVKNLIVHSGYNPDQGTSANPNDNDIALIELVGSSAQSVMQLLDNNGANLDTLIGTVAGWGKVSTTGEGSNSLLKVSLKVTGNSACNEAYGGDITDNMLCAGGLSVGDISDTCQGDSGGPLFLNQSGQHLQIGIVSFGGTATGPACSDPNAPGVYTRVSQYRNFILETVPAARFVALQTTSPSATARRFDSLEEIAGYSSAKANSAARFAGGLTRDNGQTFETSASTADFVRIMGQIRPLAADVGRATDIYIVERKDGVFSMKTVDGNFIPWEDGRIASLVPAIEGVSLSDNFLVEVYASSQLVSGDHRLFFGYIGRDGLLHYNRDALRIMIQAPSN